MLQNVWQFKWKSKQNTFGSCAAEGRAQPLTMMHWICLAMLHAFQICCLLCAVVVVVVMVVMVVIVVIVVVFGRPHHLDLIAVVRRRKRVVGLKKNREGVTS
jgi:uncharacterized membrane protein YbaN (DUF454 family)